MREKLVGENSGEEAGGPGGGGERGEERERPSERHRDSLEEVCRRASAVWAEVFPVEMSCIPAMVGSQFFLRVTTIIVILTLISFFVNIFVLAARGDYISEDDPVSLMVILHIQGALLLIMPWVSLSFFRLNILNPDLKGLISCAMRHDSLIKLKCTIISRVNILTLVCAVVLYSTQEHNYTHLFMIIIFSVIYLGPLTMAVTLSMCVIEFHRIKIQLFRHEVNEKRAILDDQIWATYTEDFNNLIDIENKSMRESEVEMNSKQSKILSDSYTSSGSYVHNNPLDFHVVKLQRQYYQLYAICARSSMNFGLYYLLFIFFGLLYASATLLGIYMDEYPTQGIVGFVIYGLLLALGTGGTLTACNETGHLLCRDLTSFLLSQPSINDIRSIKSSEDNSGADVRLLSAMSFMKLQICYFGNMALRSSMSFAVLGSLLVAIVPVLIEKEG